MRTWSCIDYSNSCCKTERHTSNKKQAVDHHVNIDTKSSGSRLISVRAIRGFSGVGTKNLLGDTSGLALLQAGGTCRSKHDILHRGLDFIFRRTEASDDTDPEGDGVVGD